MFRVTKTYGHELGLSSAFRQWRAKSHCRFIHGYALSIRFEFGCYDRDANGWVIDFGGLKSLRTKLEENYDHKLLVAGDDPELHFYRTLHDRGIADVRIFPNGVGCEAFAAHCAGLARTWLAENGHDKRVHLVSCEVREHGANSAILTEDNT